LVLLQSTYWATLPTVSRGSNSLIRRTWQDRIDLGATTRSLQNHAGLKCRWKGYMGRLMHIPSAEGKTSMVGMLEGKSALVT
jgi:hypothetical protein